MAPRRSRSNSSASSPGMSPASRYMSNMNVIRRRDSSIVSIFDQFSHVCVYHHNGDKWEKQGYEGSMFLYERYHVHHPCLALSSYPHQRLVSTVRTLYYEPCRNGGLHPTCISRRQRRRTWQLSYDAPLPRLYRPQTSKCPLDDPRRPRHQICS